MEAIRDRIKEMRRVKASDLLANPRNWRKHPEAQRSAMQGVLDQIGIADALIAREDDSGNLVLLDGHLRQDLDPDTEWPVLILDVTEAEADTILATLDPLAAMAETDAGLLENLIADLPEFENGIQGLLDDLAKDAGILSEPEIIEDEIPEVPTDPITKPGDLWLLGEHRLLCGDATKAEDVGRVMDGSRDAFCFTSPPFSDMRDYHGSNNDVGHLSQFIPAASKHVFMYIVNLGIQRKDGRIYPYWNEYIEAAESAGYPLTSWNVWSKRGVGGSIANITAMFPIEHEWLFVFGGTKQDVRRTKKNKAAGLPTGKSNRQKDGTTKIAKPTLVKNYGRIGTVTELCYGKHKDHPAAYPVALPAEYIEACADVGDAIFDPFLGSGTTLIAAEQLGRKCYGLEISPQYCDVIVERWQNLTGEKATRASSPQGKQASQ